MENISGNMEENVKTSPKKRKKNRGWTVLMIGENGETKRIRGFKKMAYTGFIVCLLSISTAIYFLLMYYHALEQNKQLKETIAISKSLYGDAKVKKKKAVVAKSPFIFKPRLHNNTPDYFKGIGPFHFSNQPDLDLSKELTYMPDTKTPKKINPRNFNPINRVRIENFNLMIKPEKNMLRMNFVLRNAKKAKKAISGTTFVILKNNLKEDLWVSIPDTKLRRGRPLRYKKGRAFYVARFKTIRHRGYNIENLEIYNKATVLVYSTRGRLLVDRTFPIEMIL